MELDWLSIIKDWATATAKDLTPFAVFFSAAAAFLAWSVMRRSYKLMSRVERPILVLTYTGSPQQQVVVRNVGRTPAADVTVTVRWGHDTGKALELVPYSIGDVTGKTKSVQIPGLDRVTPDWLAKSEWVIKCRDAGEYPMPRDVFRGRNDDTPRLQRVVRLPRLLVIVRWCWYRMRIFYRKHFPKPSKE